MTKQDRVLEALHRALDALEQAPDWRYIGHPHYETWHKGPRAEALAAIRKVVGS